MTGTSTGTSTGRYSCFRSRKKSFSVEEVAGRAQRDSKDESAALSSHPAF